MVLCLASRIGSLPRFTQAYACVAYRQKRHVEIREESNVVLIVKRFEYTIKRFGKVWGEGSGKFKHAKICFVSALPPS